MAITGSIAAVKSYDATRMFQNNGYDVQCIVSNGGERFISRLALESLSGYPVLGPDIFSFKNSEASKHENLTRENYNKKNISEIFAHIECTKNIDAVVVLPASANFLANFAHGCATDFLSATILANIKPVLLCPAMNAGMWENKVVQNNIKIIQNIYKNTTNLEIINPQQSGVLACGDVGVGKLAHLENIFLHFQKLVEKNRNENNKENTIRNKIVVINMGGTQEQIDPVRFIGNFSSGETGKIIAEQCFILGAKKVICIVGNVNVSFKNLQEIKNFEIIKLENNSAQEMLEATEKYSKNADIVIFAAAVSDFTPKKYSQNKIKKDSNKNICNLYTIDLSETADIAKYISNKYINNISNNNKIFVGFALETEENSVKLKTIIQKKCESKNLDYIFGNSPKNFNQNKNSNAYNYSLYSKKTQNFLDISKFLNENKDVFFRKILKSLL